MKKLILPIVLLSLQFLVNAQQTPILNHSLVNKYLLNPAVAGTEEFSPIRAHIKSQWTGFSDGNPKTQFLSGHTSMEDYGLGGSIFNDQYGSFKKTGIAFTYSYKVEVNDDYSLSFGLSPSIYQYSINQSDYMFFDSGDNSITGAKEAGMIFDANAGLYFYSEKFQAGLAALQLLQPKYEVGLSDEKNNLLRTIVVHAGTKLDASDKIIIEPLLAGFLNSSGFLAEISVNTWYDNKYWIGLGYRTSGQALIVAGLKFNNYYLGYSFELGFSGMADYSNGTHEILLGIDLFSKNSSSLIK
ncbi:MAG: type IX secretion system membrane protein PorP/SprF [Bacteroidales bacterium]|nr:type IX secretion system membrane protein PorP/SprF [Bacteroidales bacterium]